MPWYVDLMCLVWLNLITIRLFQVDKKIKKLEGKTRYML